MGACCYYRPSDAMIQAHLNAESSQNDSLFYQLPERYSQPPSEDSSNFRAVSRLKSEYMRLDTLKKDCLGRLKEIGTTIPYLLIEVQKGRDLFVRNYCRKGVRLQAIVQLLPKGHSALTSESDLVIPFWYSAFTLLVEGATDLRVTIVLKSKCTSPIEIGHCEVSLHLLKDQRIVTRWFPIKYQTPEGEPAIRLRMQLVEDEKKLLQRILQETTKRLADVHSELDPIDIPAEEARGE